jgi:hypothetical protein
MSAADFCTGLLPTGLISFCRRGPSGIDGADDTSPDRPDADIPRAALSKLPDCPTRCVGHPFQLMKRHRLGVTHSRHARPFVPGIHVFADLR